MQQPFPRSEWYDQSLPETKVPAAAPPPKKHRPGLKASMIVVSVLVLIVASVYAFSDRGTAGREWVGAFPTDTPSGGTEDEYAEDFRRFFADYYTAPETQYSGSSLERAQGEPGVRLQIISAEDRPELSLRELYRESIASIVGVKAGHEGRAGFSWGCGIVFSEEGYVVTNQHIIDKANKAYVVLPDGTEREAVLIGEDTGTDIAVLKIQAGGLTAAEFGDSDALAVGDSVAAIGNPLGSELSGTMTDGIISAINRDLTVNGRRMTLLQTNAAINEGSSGGPLLNMYGQVIGITNMKMANNYSNVTIEGIGFAIPSVVVKSVADQLIEHGAVIGRPRLGVTLGMITEDIAEYYTLPEGLYVYAVTDGSDAKVQGVREGDIVTHVDGQEVRTTEDVLALRNARAVGDVMVLTIWRDGQTIEIPIRLVDQNTLK